MLDTKQLYYFVTAAECSSFSEAAKILYSSQSNVSKVIGSLEKQLGYSLFEREQNGILLNSRGKMFYQQVAPLVESLEQLEMDSADSGNGIIRISANPNPWFAKRFSEFYGLHEDEQVRYNIHTDSTFHIVQRIRKMEDDAGFVYVFPEEYDRLKYELKRYQIDFFVLGSTPGMVYLSTEENATNPEKRHRSMKGIRLIQAEMDNYKKSDVWICEKNGERLNVPPVAITTNSDYIMNIMMNENGLANISPKSFNKYEKGTEPGFVINREAGDILFGVLLKQDTEQIKIISEFIEYIRHSIG